MYFEIKKVQSMANLGSHTKQHHETAISRLTFVDSIHMRFHKSLLDKTRLQKVNKHGDRSILVSCLSWRVFCHVVKEEENDLGE